MSEEEEEGDIHTKENLTGSPYRPLDKIFSDFRRVQDMFMSL